MSTKNIAIAVIFLAVVSVAYGWMRWTFADAEIVSRAELIVVGSVKESTLRCLEQHLIYLPENHLELQVTEFLKGTNHTRNIPVCITWGLTPVTGGYYRDSIHGVDWKGWTGNTNYPKDVIEVFDTGNSISGLPPFTGDIRTNHIWLLRHTYRGSNYPDLTYSYYCRSNWLSIYDPEDIQPMRRKNDLMRHLK